MDLGNTAFWENFKTDPASLAALVCSVDVINLDRTLQQHSALRAWVGATYECARIEEEKLKWQVTKTRALALLFAKKEMDPDTNKANGRAVLAAEAMGADGAYVGSAFIATDEARAAEDYKNGIVKGRAGDIVYTNLFTGVHGNYLRASIEASGLDPDNLPESDATLMDFGGASAKPKAWKEIWGSGQGIGAVRSVGPAAALVDRLAEEYAAAKRQICG
ncbi:hypothetical protein LCGC14_2285480 [marine sediment metagenome]|uniref:Uncharacterized protein n=1 Tax=marine sediment metagenome TaxID=412755 RepID=A0A0F9FN15_9ZZZZ